MDRGRRSVSTQEDVLQEIDQAVEFGRKHRVHVNLCLHRAPGYTVAHPPEKLNLWEDEEAKAVLFPVVAFCRPLPGHPFRAIEFQSGERARQGHCQIYSRSFVAR